MGVSFIGAHREPRIHGSLTINSTCAPHAELVRRAAPRQKSAPPVAQARSFCSTRVRAWSIRFAAGAQAGSSNRSCGPLACRWRRRPGDRCTFNPVGEHNETESCSSSRRWRAVHAGFVAQQPRRPQRRSSAPGKATIARTVRSPPPSKRSTSAPVRSRASRQQLPLTVDPEVQSRQVKIGTRSWCAPHRTPVAHAQEGRQELRGRTDPATRTRGGRRAAGAAAARQSK
jgi:hypothetical protein